MSKNFYTRKKPVLLIPDKIYIEEELIKIINVSVKHDRPKFENYVYPECSDGVNRFFYKYWKVLYDNVNDNGPLNDGEYDHEDDVICKTYLVINRIKNKYI